MDKLKLIIAFLLIATGVWAQENQTDSTMFSPALGMQPVGWYGSPLQSTWSPYSLHDGLNVSVGMSLATEFGKHARNGVGFGQNVEALYIHPFNKHLWFTAGGYIDHLFWGGDSYTAAGLRGELGYQFNENWAAFLYGQKSLTNHGGYFYGRYGGTGYGRMAWGLSPFGYDSLTDKIGAGVRWTPNPNFSLEVRVGKDWLPYDMHP
jgi:hypothetical protein